MYQGPVQLDRYTLYDPIAAGGMATVHYGRLLAPGGFGRTVAIKRIHPELATDPDFVEMFLSEARLAARIQHPNVVQTLDIVQTEQEVFVVLEYIHGESLGHLLRECRKSHAHAPIPIVAALMIHLLQGLQAAHDARNEQGEPLQLVHRDISPQNILVGVDGLARVADFGIAKARGQASHTREGEVKGKIAYMAPEQLRAEPVDARADLFSCGVIFWEALTNRRLFSADSDVETIQRLLDGPIVSPGKYVPSIPQGLADAVLRALDRQRDGRFASASAFAAAIEHTCRPASPREIGEWLKLLVSRQLEAKNQIIEKIERHSSQLKRPTHAPTRPPSEPPPRAPLRTVPLPAMQPPAPAPLPPAAPLPPRQQHTVPLQVYQAPAPIPAPSAPPPACTTTPPPAYAPPPALTPPQGPLATPAPATFSPLPAPAASVLAAPPPRSFQAPPVPVRAARPRWGWWVVALLAILGATTASFLHFNAPGAPTSNATRR